MSPQPTILLATTNPAKEERLRWLLEGLGFLSLRPQDFPRGPEVEEAGTSHRENAVRKATSWAGAVGSLALVSDGGAVIPALGTRWDSLTTKRALGPGQDDIARIESLLRLMEGYHGAERRVFWREALALAGPGGLLHTWEVEGNHATLAESYESQRVIPGFWLASLWYYPHLRKIHLDLSPEELEAVGDVWLQLHRQVRQSLPSLGLVGERNSDSL